MTFLAQLLVKLAPLPKIIVNNHAQAFIFIGFNFSTILNASPEKRAQIIGRMQQNVKLCRKYKVKMFLGSFAKDPYELRSDYELKAFGFMLGMNPKEVKNSVILPL